MSDHDIEQRLRAFAAGPDESADWEDVLSRARGRSSARRLARRRLVPALAVLVVVAAALVGSFVLLGRSASPTGPTGTSLGGPSGPSVTSPDGSNPWGQHGRQITIGELRSEAPYLPLPSSDLANDGNVGTVWVWDHTSDPTVPEHHVAAAVYYASSGIELSWTGGGLDYTGLESRTIDGVRAMLIPGDWSPKGPTGATGSTSRAPALSILRLPVGSHEVLTLEGIVPESELIDVAKTLNPPPGDASPAGDLPPATPQPGPYLTSWDGMLTDGVAASSVSDAASSLGFRPVAPASLGDPSAIQESDPATPLRDRTLSLRYDDAAKGSLWLLERPSLTATTSLLKEIASECTRASGCKDTASMLDLGGGVTALSLEDPVSNRIVWVDGGVYYEVVVPATTFTSADAISIAKATAAAAAG